jgi:hypothetical protein
MKIKHLIIFLLLTVACKAPQKVTPQSTNPIPPLPGIITGNFTDDYGIRYAITDTLWLQQPSIRYRILQVDTVQQFLLARNDLRNPTDKGLYTRIDYMQFNNMEPYRWGFCLTVYNAKSDSLAAAAQPADRQNPRKGCNGFPFSRMKRTVE